MIHTYNDRPDRPDRPIWTVRAMKPRPSVYSLTFAIYKKNRYYYTNCSVQNDIKAMKSEVQNERMDSI